MLDFLGRGGWGLFEDPACFWPRGLASSQLRELRTQSSEPPQWVIFCSTISSRSYVDSSVAPTRKVIAGCVSWKHQRSYALLCVRFRTLDFVCLICIPILKVPFYALKGTFHEVVLIHVSWFQPFPAALDARVIPVTVERSTVHRITEGHNEAIHPKTLRTPTERSFIFFWKIESSYFRSGSRSQGWLGQSHVAQTLLWFVCVFQFQFNNSSRLQIRCCAFPQSCCSQVIWWAAPRPDFVLHKFSTIAWFLLIFIFLYFLISKNIFGGGSHIRTLLVCLQKKMLFTRSLKKTPLFCCKIVRKVSLLFFEFFELDSLIFLNNLMFLSCVSIQA